MYITMIYLFINYYIFLSRYMFPLNFWLTLDLVLVKAFTRNGSLLSRSLSLTHVVLILSYLIDLGVLFPLYN